MPTLLFLRKTPVIRGSKLRFLTATAGLLALLWPGLARPAQAEAAVQAGLDRARQSVVEDNPAELWVARGEATWHAPGGPRRVALDRCDLGLGPGITRGAVAALPRWFADAGQVMDLEQRLMWCLQTLQGMDAATAAADHFSSSGHHAVMEDLSAFLAEQSRGLPVAVQLAHPEEKRLFALGEQLFRYRAGPYDFACATCHGQQGLRIRLQPLPMLTLPEDARRSWTTWPAYRLSQGEVRTMQHRLYDCFRQQRFPEVRYGSEAITALSLYLAWNARGGLLAAPSVKR